MSLTPTVLSLTPTPAVLFDHTMLVRTMIAIECACAYYVREYGRSGCERESTVGVRLCLFDHTKWLLECDVVAVQMIAIECACAPVNSSVVSRTANERVLSRDSKIKEEEVLMH